MKKFSFTVDLVGSDVDRSEIVDVLTAALNDNLGNDIHANVKQGEIKELSEQGYKVWRARVTGVTAIQAGDAANPPKKKVVAETVEA